MPIPSKPLTARDAVELCGLFTDAYSKRELDLDLPNKATLTVLAPDAGPADDILTSKKTAQSKGQFTVEPDNREIDVSFGGSARRYEVFSPPGVGECILVSGQASTADLTQSWFGSIEDSDNNGGGHDRSSDF